VEKRPEEILERSTERGKGEVRSMLWYGATERLGINQREVPSRFKLTQPAVSQAVRKGNDLLTSQSYSLFHD